LAIPSTSTASTRPNPEFLSVVIPAFNEETRLAKTLPVVLDYLRAQFERFELLVIDDGSTDQTAVIAETVGARVLRLPVNTGKGAAVRAGMLAASGEIVLFSDADLSTPIAEIAQALVLHREGIDVVMGSRALPASDVQLHQNIIRESMGKMFNVFVRLLAELPFRDTQCGFKSFRRAAAQAVFERCRVNGFAFDVEALIIAQRLGYRLADMPVRWVNSPQSKVKILLHPLQMFIELVGIRWRNRR